MKHSRSNGGVGQAGCCGRRGARDSLHRGDIYTRNRPEIAGVGGAKTHWDGGRARFMSGRGWGKDETRDGIEALGEEGFVRDGGGCCR